MLLLYFYIVLRVDLERAGLTLSVWVTVSDILRRGVNLARMSDHDPLVISTIWLSGVSSGFSLRVADMSRQKAVLGLIL